MYLMLLNDGETYTNLEGCKILEVRDDYTDEEVPANARVVADFGPNDMVVQRVGAVVTLL